MKQRDSIAMKDGCTLFEEGADAFLVIVAIVNVAAKGLETLKGLRVEWVGVREDTHFFFHHAQNKR